ncbi:glutamate receptor ionotropic, delta-2-like [Scylla paramamosain]|uniref:glutamate receptor ionotropic, delta-2-like n=1 Tax=Scylla paramamosain TaxID=85552 RepID=UPI003083B1DF
MHLLKNFMLLLLSLLGKAPMGQMTLMTQVGAAQVSTLVTGLVKQHFSNCHLVLLTTMPHSPVFSAIRNQMNEGTVVATDTMREDSLQEVLSGEVTTVCQVLIIHFDHTNEATNETALVFRLLERAGLWKKPKTRVVVVGSRTSVKDILLHHSLRNTMRGFYLAFHSSVNSFPRHLRLAGPSEEPISGRVSVFRRCMYCDGGEPAVRLVGRMNLELDREKLGITDLSSALSEPFKDLRGHTFEVTTVPYFPYVAYSRGAPEQGSKVTLQDSLNVRILSTASAALNFTYEVWETPDRSFGNLNAQGQYSGLVGELQREESDFCLLLTPTSDRLEVIDYLRLEPTDYLVVLSEKPSLLSAVMSFTRPFSNELWVGLVVGLIVWSVTAWLLQLLWKAATGGPGVSLVRTLMYGWGALLEKPPADPSRNFSGQMLVGWWLVFCFVIVTGFKSSLIAHLTVQAKSQTPEGFQDLVEFDNWRWGIEPWMLDGQLLNYFEKNTDQVVQEVYQRMEKLPLKELLQKVLEGRYSMVSVKNYIMVIMASSYVDKYGQMPFHMGREERGILACFGWGIRKGAPFLEAFLSLASRLEDAGLVKHWTEVVVAQRVKETRAKNAPKATNVFGSLEDEKEVVLSMDHLQGAFYLLFLGSGVASITLLAEITGN